MASAGARSVLVFDGECGFCRCWVTRARHAVGERIEFAAFQDAATRYPRICRADFQKAAHLIEPDGRVSRGAEAILRTYALAGRRQLAYWAYRRVPGIATAAESAYRFVASHRPFFSRFMRCTDDPAADPRAMYLTRRVFTSGLGVIYLLAFASLLPQILGLAGSDGILPVAEMLESATKRFGDARYWQTPTVLWLNPSDGLLRGLCHVGIGLSILLIFDIAPVITLFLLWACYLSVTVAGGEFLYFQWDALLLETGLLAIFLAPLHIVPRAGRLPPPPSIIAVWLMRWLLFRLMLLSGLVKLLSGDQTWWPRMTAIADHYETQPLTNWVAWHFHQLPMLAQQACCGIMYVIELLLPLLIFLGRRARLVAFAGFVLLQVMIILTGNYGFFNLLTLVLCIMLLDDGAWPRSWQRRHGRHGPRVGASWPPALVAAVGICVLFFTLVPALHRLRISLPASWRSAYATVSPLRSFNSYGLFAAMTHKRPEIIIEGSDDGREWREYEFRYKPGDVRRRPPFVMPHMPRLDWQMWFAALGSARHHEWFGLLVKRLLEGSPHVLGLLGRNPFPDRPPRYIRARLYDYRLTNADTRAANGCWWTREDKGLYCRPLQRESFRMRGP